MDGQTLAFRQRLVLHGSSECSALRANIYTDSIRIIQELTKPKRFQSKRDTHDIEWTPNMRITQTDFRYERNTMAKRIAFTRPFPATYSCPVAGTQQTVTSSGGVGLKHNGGSGIPIVSMTFHAPVVGWFGARHQYQSRKASSWSGLTEPVVLIGSMVDERDP